MKIKTQADIAALEKLPAGERIRHKNVLEIVRASAAAHADRVAFRALSGTTPNDPARDVTYAEMLRRVIQTANLLQASGVGPNDRPAQARAPHPRRAGDRGLDQHADVRPRAGRGADQPAAAVPCRRLDRRRPGADRQRLDRAAADAARRAQPQRGARLVEPR